MNGFRDATVLYRLGNWLARFCFRTFGRLEIDGAECVPRFGPLIVVCNHLSLNDPPLLVAAIPRPLFFVGKQELFSNPIFRFLMRGFHLSPFDRSTAGIDAVRVLMQNLERDRAIVIFPEGHRSPDQTLQQGMLGAVYLALKSQAPILPVAVTGTQKFPLWRIPFPFSRMKASIGTPFSLPVIEGQPSRAVMNSLLDMVMGRIAGQLPPELRGAYGPKSQEESREEPAEQPI
ncbi:MAG: lysophospholipid acyltransferase family protein [Chloroflexi bacterium]|nr:lysophospholipid acyltransferase family protein [Chloroflexota bacterium]MDA1271255.1 lysophospholipid acyltransferase family protein [Chloroflexota bacterium]